MRSPSRRFLSQILRIAVLLTFLKLAYDWNNVPAMSAAVLDQGERGSSDEDSRTSSDHLDPEELPENSFLPTPNSTASSTITTASATTSTATTALQSLHLDKIFVINVKERSDRRRLLEAQMKFHGVEVDFVQAQTPGSYQTRRLLQDRDLPPNFRGSTYGQRVLSIFASHLQVFEEIVRHNYQATLILEDDVDVDMGWREDWPKLFRELQDMQGKDGWDLLLLGHCAMAHSDPLPIARSSFNDGEAPQSSWHTTSLAYCAHSYIVSGNLVRRFLDRWTTPREAFDIDFFQFCLNNQAATTPPCNTFVLVPPMFAQIPRDKDNPTVNGEQSLPAQSLRRSTLKHLGLSIRSFQ